MVIQESVTKISWRDCLHSWETAISHGSRRPQTETAGAHQWGKPVVSLRQEGMKPLRKNAGGRKSEQHPYHSHPKPSSVQSAVGSCLLLQLLCEGPIWCPSVMCHPVTHWMKWLTMWGLDFLYLFFIPGLQCWSHCTGYPFADGFCQSCQCLYSTAGVYYSISATLMLLVAILQSKLTISSVPKCMVTVLAPVLTLIFSRYWSKLHFDGQQMWCQTI